MATAHVTAVASPAGFTVRLSNGRSITGPDEVSVRRVAQQIEDQAIRRTMWPEGNRAQMTALAKLFPSMTRWGGSPVPGTDPWEPEALVQWLNSGEPSSGSRHAGLFLLSVWNRDDWATYGLKVPRLRKDDWKGSRRIGRWDVNDAWAAWDDTHRAAALAWLNNPFWP
jgi:hypothetical protein